MILESEDKALSAVNKMKAGGLHNVFRIADYGLHIYSNILSLVNKVPLSPAGNPWNLIENKASIYDYNKGSCPVSDKLFAKSILLPIPSVLTLDQELGAVEVIKESIK
jgi:hypothetical protein